MGVLSQASGVAVSDSCINAFTELKLGHSHRYVIYKLNDSLTEIVPDVTADHSKGFNDFLDALPKNECRYCVYDFDYEEENAKKSKILFVLWCVKLNFISKRIVPFFVQSSLINPLVI
jgi:cofilin